MHLSPAEVPLGARHLTVEDIAALAAGSATAVVSSAVRAQLAAGYDFLRELAARRVPVYGLTTGCGPLAEHGVEPAHREAFQRNLVRSHAVCLGRPHAVELVRVAMAVRAHVLARGHSGVDPHLVEALVGMLNTGIHPIVGEIGGVGASGDLVELAQIALAVFGEGVVEFGGRRCAASEALQAAGIEPVVPRYREGLALINGTSFHTGAGALLTVRAARVVAAAEVAAALGFEALQGEREALDPLLQRARPHAGQDAVAQHVAAIVTGSRLLRDDGSPAHRQDPYTLRCIAQILGPVVTTLAKVRETIETEINAVCDNPIFLPDERRVVHGGNFHGQPVAAALDQLKTALVGVGVQSERRTARLLDPSLNRGLPAFLVADAAGVHSGFMGLQYCASVMAAENLLLSAPASVHSIPTNANNQDVVSMGMLAARQTLQVLDNVQRMVAIELLCAAQAVDLRGPAKAGSGSRAVLRLIREQVAILREDRPLTGDVEAICAWIASSNLLSAALAGFEEPG